ncbi:ChrR family anti-sigma-E factor [Cochlodiniinecator piscidefendens]|uniref:ChrR family anti-sigma-E factor n=1 Tax=Cochlodiniinecator piscidefendens TaxID=2715756 RepID=UPI00140C409C|nr:ChrR family anti-sigma-E factor [Cochlodiniinecator piscidefendens]
MSAIKHHIPDHLLAAYSAGNLSDAFALVVATHISMCSDCRASLEAHHMTGGIFLEDAPAQDISAGLKGDILAQLDNPFRPEPVHERRGIYPGPLNAALKAQDPIWKKLGMGVHQSILSADSEGSVRLLWIPAGQKVPDHGHNGLELTLVLQGSFSDETGFYGTGDLEIGDEDLEHTPTAGPDMPCICLAATDAPLRFKDFMPRLLQPLFRI